ncbi:tetratricopeptide repeat protein [Fulvimarina sp. 2208YS6-2-32]|uniref:Ancillary SecYEG translocon subunit n=1 Tax=Fulvimarina uroteuthidis TaxID=3098149 RepID=A0ABU5I857_9HYPH|nr:tetratricopeptide repeat protein [Fulvimarina sp. 2208YS6-2-32]MDY8110421.1 tetratricopeptide repeat protein [Fulvimarina sp. 2208YS6-2-32]
MSDEGFFREVSEELRQDRLKSIWTRFGTVIIAGIVVVIVGTASYVGYQRYAVAQANSSGDRYLAAQDLVAQGDVEGAIAAFENLAADGWGAYPELARLSIANAHAADGRFDEAIAAYADVASDGSVPEALREMADLRAAYLLVDHGTLAEVRARAERLTGDDNPLRYAARDAIGLAAWKAGEVETARDLYQSIVDAGDAPGGITQRASLILGLMTAGSDGAGAVSAPAEPAAPAPAEDAAATPDQSATPAPVAPPASDAGAAADAALPEGAIAEPAAPNAADPVAAPSGDGTTTEPTPAPAADTPDTAPDASRTGAPATPDADQTSAPAN